MVNAEIFNEFPTIYIYLSKKSISENDVFEFVMTARKN